MHRVRRHASASGGERVSLVTEQYIVPEPYLARLPYFYMLGQSGADADEIKPYIQSGQLQLDPRFGEARRRPAAAAAQPAAASAAAAAHAPATTWPAAQ